MDALAGNLSLELGKRQQNVEGKSVHRGRGVVLPGDGHDRHALGFKQLDQLGESASERVRRSTL